MAVITEAELREMWQTGRGEIGPLPAGTRFTPAARDFINQWRIQISFAAESGSAAQPEDQAAAARPAWDKPGEFPVRLEGPVPVCTVCGQPVRHKPGHMAQLDAEYFALKSAPRFVFRGKMDTLHAHFLLAAAQARRLTLLDLADCLATLSAYCREITSAEYNERDVGALEMAGLNEAEIHDRTHWPERTMGIGHVVPEPQDHEMLLQLNWLRCQAREVELVAYSVFTGPDGRLTRPDLPQALNRLSSGVYYLVLLFKAGKFTWKGPDW